MFDYCTARRLFLSGVILASAGSGALAQTCDPQRGVVFFFDSAAPLVSSVTIKDLTASGKRLTGTGMVSLRDDSRIPVQVKAAYRALSTDTVTYRLRPFRGATSRARGTIVTDGCLSRVSKVRFSVSPAKGVRYEKVTDTSLVKLSGVMKSKVVVLDTTDIGGLTLNPLDKTLIVPSSDDLLGRLHVGSVLLGGVTPATPNGLLRTITGLVSQDDTATVFATTPASLADAYQRLDVAFGSTTLGPLRRTMQQDLATPEISMEPLLITKILPVADILGDVSGIAIFGEVKVIGELSLGIHLDNGVLGPSLNVQEKFDGLVAADATVSFPLGAAVALSQPVWVLPIPIPIEGFVLNLVVEWGVDAGAGYNGKVSGQAFDHVSTGFDCTYDPTSVIGGPDCTPILDFDTPTVCAGMFISGTRQFKAFIEAKAALLFGDIVGPAVAPLQVYFKVDADTSRNPWWTTSLGLGGEVSLDLNPLLPGIGGEVWSHDFSYGPGSLAVELSHAFPGPYPGVGENGDLVCLGDNPTSTTSVPTTSTSTTTSTLPNTESLCAGTRSECETKCGLYCGAAQCDQTTSGQFCCVSSTTACSDTDECSTDLDCVSGLMRCIDDGSCPNATCKYECLDPAPNNGVSVVFSDAHDYYANDNTWHSVEFTVRRHDQERYPAGTSVTLRNMRRVDTVAECPFDGGHYESHHTETHPPVLLGIPNTSTTVTFLGDGTYRVHVGGAGGPDFPTQVTTRDWGTDCNLQSYDHTTVNDTGGVYDEVADFNFKVGSSSPKPGTPLDSVFEGDQQFTFDNETPVRRIVWHFTQP
jgi:hypothetical protein